MARGPLTTDDGRVDDGSLVAARVLLAEAGEVAAEWRELCRWDPELAPDTVPPAVVPVVAAVAGALNRRQLLGRGARPAVAGGGDPLSHPARTGVPSETGWLPAAPSPV